MKYLVSIIVVLLMVNFLAQAEDPDIANPITVKGSPIAEPIGVSDMVRQIDDGSNKTYVKDMKFKGKNDPKKTAAGMKDCDKVGGACDPLPKKLKLGDKSNTSGRKGAPVADPKAGKATK
jgi:hypothetical protein